MITAALRTAAAKLGLAKPARPGERDRAAGWPAARARHLKLNPTCAACGGTKELQVHHILPFHLFPAEELNPGNLITLCEAGTNCHLAIGHKGNFQKRWNPKVREDAAYLLKRYQEAP